MKLLRSIVSAVFVPVLLSAACAGATTDPGGINAFGDVVEPEGPELLSLSRTALTLAPGRETWLHAYTFIQTSPTSLATVAPRVTFESSNTNVASVSTDSVGVGRIVARAEGAATITVRSQREGSATRSTTITVAKAPLGNEAGLVFTAKAAIVPTRSSTGTVIPLGPADLDVTVTISNPTSTPKDIWLSGCGAWIRLYKTPDLTGAPVVDIPRNVQCASEDRHLTLAPGAAETVGAEGYRLDISPDTLPAGRYYVAAALDRIRDLVNVAAGPIDIVSPNAGLTFAAATTVSNANLNVSAKVTNTNAAPVRLEYGACAVTLLAYRSADRAGKPAWNSDLRRPYGDPDARYGCPQYLAVGVLDPGATQSPRELNPSFPVLEMLGDSLPNARYYFKAVIRMNWRSAEVPAGDADVRR